MAITEGSTQYFAFKKETTPNTEESGSGATILRRTEGRLDLTKAEVLSSERRDDFQQVTANHGTRAVSFSINGELVAGDYSAFMAAILRRQFTAITAIDASAGDGFTISSGVLTRGAGGSESFVTDGVLPGLIVRLADMAATGNNGRNALVTALTATTLGLLAADGGTAIANDASANESASLSVPGKITYMPSSGHTSDTFTVERYDRATDTSHIARGVKIGTMEVSITADQQPTISFTGIGVDRRNVDTSSAPVLTAPAAAGTGAAMSPSIGFVRLNGVAVGVVVSAQFSVDLGVNNNPMAFANVSPDIFYGQVMQVTGTLTVLRQGLAVENIYDNETEVDLNVIFMAPGSEPRQFINFYFERVKLFSSDLADNDGATPISATFRALKGSNSALLVQDSSLS